MVISASLLAVHGGRIAPLGPDLVPSAFVKTPLSGAVQVHPGGLQGDEQADLSVHGGPEKAVYGYAAAHYPAWRAELPEHAAQFGNGAMGENLVIAGMDEAALCVGDVHQIGSVVLQVCQPRRPCFKLALRFGDNRLPRAMVRNGRAGWYYRVLEPGSLRAGDAVTLSERPHPDFSFARLVSIVNYGNATMAELSRMTEMAGLASQWRARASEALREGNA